MIFPSFCDVSLDFLLKETCQVACVLAAAEEELAAAKRQAEDSVSQRHQVTAHLML